MQGTLAYYDGDNGDDDYDDDDSDDHGDNDGNSDYDDRYDNNDFQLFEEPVYTGSLLRRIQGTRIGHSPLTTKQPCMH